MDLKGAIREALIQFVEDHARRSGTMDRKREQIGQGVTLTMTVTVPINAGTMDRKRKQIGQWVPLIEIVDADTGLIRFNPLRRCIAFFHENGKTQIVVGINPEIKEVNGVPYLIVHKPNVSGRHEFRTDRCPIPNLQGPDFIEIPFSALDLDRVVTMP